MWDRNTKYLIYLLAIFFICVVYLKLLIYEIICDGCWYVINEMMYFRFCLQFAFRIITNVGQKTIYVRGKSQST